MYDWCAVTGDILMEYIMSKNPAHHSADSSMLTADNNVNCEQQQQCSDSTVHVSVKHTVEHLLSRLGLSQLTSLIDKTIISQSDTDTIQVRVIRSTQQQSAADDANDESDVAEDKHETLGRLQLATAVC